jgi:hypothetical protein
MLTQTDTLVAEPAELLADPPRLLAAWQHLQATRHHLHAPEAARLLSVPEAALTASRLGYGAVRLPNDLASILAPVHEWRRVLVAVQSAIGVHLAIGPVRLEADEPGSGLIRLRGDHLDTVLDGRSVAHAFWSVEVDDSHGRTRSLQFFDAAGGSVAKVFIFHKTAAAKAERGFDALAVGVDQAAFAPAPAADPAIPLPHPDGCQTLAGPADTALKALFARLDGSHGPLRVELHTPVAVQRFAGVVTHGRVDAAMVHLHEQDIRAHLRPGALVRAQVMTSGDGVVGGFAFSGVDRSVLIVAAKDDPVAFARWATPLARELSA